MIHVSIRPFLAGMVVGLVLFCMMLSRLAAQDILPLTTYALHFVDIPLDGQHGITALLDVSDNTVPVLLGKVNNGFREVAFEQRGFTAPMWLTCPGTQTQVSAINRMAQVTGACDATAFLFRPSRAVNPYRLLEVPQTQSSTGLGVNDVQSVVGVAFAQQVGQGFTFVSSRFRKHTAPFAGVTLTAFTSINNAGQILGHYQDQDSINHGFTLTFPNNDPRQAGTYVPFDIPGISTVPIDHNDHGQVVGLGVLDAGMPDEAVFSFYFDGTTFWRVTVQLPGVVWTEVSGLNNAGLLAGRVVDQAGSRGFLAIPIEGPPAPEMQAQTLAFTAVARMATWSAAGAEATVPAVPLKLALQGCTDVAAGVVVPAKLERCR